MYVIWKKSSLVFISSNILVKYDLIKNKDKLKYKKSQSHNLITKLHLTNFFTAIEFFRNYLDQEILAILELTN